MKKILIAEDDANIRAGLVDLFESDGFGVCAVGDGAAALAQYGAGHFDLVLLDVMMPEKSGYDVCRDIRKSDSRVPIIMLTAKGEEIDKVVGLQLGADDYVTKPFGVHELLARVEAVLRRAGDTNRRHQFRMLFPSDWPRSTAAPTRFLWPGKVSRCRTANWS